MDKRIDKSYVFKPHSKNELRDKIIFETLKSIPRLGVEGISLRQIAKGLDVSHQAPYTHFKSKEVLFEEVCELGFGQLLDLIERNLVAVSEPFERLMTLGKTSIQFYAANPGLYQLMYNRTGSFAPQGSKSAGRLFEALTREALAAAKQHKLSKKKTQAFFLTSWCSVHGLSHLYLSGQFGRKEVRAQLSPDLETLMEMLHSFFAASLSAALEKTPGEECSYSKPSTSAPRKVMSPTT